MRIRCPDSYPLNYRPSIWLEEKDSNLQRLPPSPQGMSTPSIILQIIVQPTKDCQPFIPFVHDQFMQASLCCLTACASVGHWLTLWPHNRRLFFQGFPLASLNQTGIRACKIGLVTTLMALAFPLIYLSSTTDIHYGILRAIRVAAMLQPAPQCLRHTSALVLYARTKRGWPTTTRRHRLLRQVWD